MKEDVLDVLMYLFENYMDDDTATEADPETLKTQLREAGFLSAEINKAFSDMCSALQIDTINMHTPNALKLIGTTIRY